MAGYHPNYTDGVPVKISERFKPPPKISLPQSVIQKLSRKGPSSLKEDNYDFNYERMILARTNELQNLRIRDRNDRQQRIRLREQQRLQQIEQEQKKKLNEVSYPSTDDLNSISDDEYHIESNQKEIAKESPVPKIVRAAEVLSPQSMFDTILMPTVLPRSSPTIEDAAHPVVKKTHRRYPSQLDYAYFEADNSSPFDNMELKTINDLDILAQVLHQASTDQSPLDNNLERNNSSESESASENHPALNNNNLSDQEPLFEQKGQEFRDYKEVAQPIYIHQPNYIQHHNYPQYAGSYGNSYANYSNIPTVNAVNNHQPQNYYPVGVPAQNYVSYAPNYQAGYQWGGFEMNKTVNNNVITDKNTAGFLQSKSVPDIMKELNDELNNSENRRVRNNSQTSHSQRDGMYFLVHFIISCKIFAK